MDLTPNVGTTARRSRTVTAEDITLFTRITGDRNPLHYDDELARASRFGGLVVQGGVTSGLLNALVAEQLPGPGSVFLQVSWRFLAPVRPGDVITAEAVVTWPAPTSPSPSWPPASPTRPASSFSTAKRSSGATPT
jgi:acyl dehydratase